MALNTVCSVTWKTFIAFWRISLVVSILFFISRYSLFPLFSVSLQPKRIVEPLKHPLMTENELYLTARLKALERLLDVLLYHKFGDEKPDYPSL